MDLLVHVVYNNKFETFIIYLRRNIDKTTERKKKHYSRETVIGSYNVELMKMTNETNSILPCLGQ